MSQNEVPRDAVDVGDPVDVVATAAEAAALDVPPLIVLEGLAPYVPGSGPIEVRRLGSGHSNETFEVVRDGVGYALRRPPRGPVAPTAHDVLREHAILDALSAAGLRVPRPVAACDRLEPIGAPFYLMELVDGTVIRDAMPPELDDPDGRRQVLEELVDALVEIHAMPWRGTALEQLGRPDGYLERQLRRWKSQWEFNRTREVPAIGETAAWLEANRPETEETTLVHGDYKLDNAIYRPGTPARLGVVVDWEMATLGDPLADLGLLVATHLEEGEEPDPVLGFSTAIAAPGALTRAEIVARYAERSGRDVRHLQWYECLALWKITILLEGSYKRFLAGTTHDPFFALLADGIPRLAERALTLTRSGSTR